MCLLPIVDPPYGGPMVGRLLLVAVLVVGVLLPTAAVASDDHAVTAVSGWTPTTTDQQITGGTRAVTLVNASDAPIDIDEFALEPAPCACRIATAAATQGVVAVGVWRVGILAPGEAVTVELTYVADDRAMPTQRGWLHQRPVAV